MVVPSDNDIKVAVQEYILKAVSDDEITKKKIRSYVANKFSLTAEDINASKAKIWELTQQVWVATNNAKKETEVLTTTTQDSDDEPMSNTKSSSSSSSSSKAKSSTLSNSNSIIKTNDKNESFINLGTDKRRVTVRKWGRTKFVDVREFYEKDGTMLPGKKGISLRAEDWAVIKSNMALIDDLFDNLD